MARFTIPDRVMLRGREWSVVRMPAGKMPAPDEMGRCEREQRLIILREGMSYEDDLETYVHECMHAVRPWGAEIRDVAA